MPPNGEILPCPRDGKGWRFIAPDRLHMPLSRGLGVMLGVGLRLLARRNVLGAGAGSL